MIENTVIEVYVRDDGTNDRRCRYGCRIRGKEGQETDKSLGDWEACFFQQEKWGLHDMVLAEVTRFEAKEQSLPILKAGKQMDTIMAAADELAAGERDLKELLIYSALSSQLEGEQFHVLTMGDSQLGKSFVLIEIATSLFPSISMVVNSLSPKSLPYEAKGEPTRFKHTLIVVDELKDNQGAAVTTLKAMTTRGQKRVVCKTVDDKRNSLELVIEGMPTIWATSRDVIDDPGNQVGNRLFKTKVDETREQSVSVERWQKERMAFGNLTSRQDHVGDAVALLETIMDAKDCKVLNPFSEYIEQRDYGVRNRLPLYHALVSAISYMNRFCRRGFIIEGRRHIVATLSDNLTALRLWARFDKIHSTGLPERHQRLFKALLAGRSYTAKAAADAYNAMWGNEYGEISRDTAYNYLREMSEKNLVTSEKRVEVQGGFERVGREYEYTRIQDELPTTPQLILRMTDRTTMAYLADWVVKLKELTSQLYNFDDSVFDGLPEALIDANLPMAVGRQTQLSEAQETVNEGHDRAKEGVIYPDDINTIEGT